MTDSEAQLYTKIFSGEQNELIEKMVSKRDSSYFISYLNSHTLMLSQQNQHFRSYMAQCDLVYLDGRGPQWALRFMQIAKGKKHTSADYLPTLIKKIEEHKLSLFILGHTTEELKKICAYLDLHFPNLNLVGHHSGFNLQEDKVIEHMLKSRPDLVILGMGSPKQELFLQKHSHYLPVATYLPLGAGLLYLSKLQCRVPRWLEIFGTEWLFRLALEPTRLGPRYLKSNFHLALWTIKNLISR